MTEYTAESLAELIRSQDSLRNKGAFPMTEISRLRSSLPVELVHEAVALLVERGQMLQITQHNNTEYYTFPVSHIWLRIPWRNPMPWDDTQWSPKFY